MARTKRIIFTFAGLKQTHCHYLRFGSKKIMCIFKPTSLLSPTLARCFLAAYFAAYRAAFLVMAAAVN